MKIAQIKHQINTFIKLFRFKKLGKKQLFRMRVSNNIYNFSNSFQKFKMGLFDRTRSPYVLQGNTSNSEIPIFFKHGLIERYNPVIKQPNNIRRPNSLLSN